MSLSGCYINYLQNLQKAQVLRVLCAELEREGYALEASLLRQYSEGGPCVVPIDLKQSVWAGHRAHVGPDLPVPTQAGDIWFDTYEIMPMILLSSEPLLPGEKYAPEALARITPFSAWMALRPVANWQYKVFLQLAKIGSREVQIEPPFRMLDPVRILQGAETDPTKGLTGAEARMYANWFGKGVCGQEEWQAAARLLPSEAMSVLWGPLRREWGGSFQEDVHVVLTPDTVHVDFMEEWDRDVETEPAKRIFYGEWDMPEGVGFRTRVLTRIGLLLRVSSDPTSFDNVELLDVLKRHV